MRYEFKVLVEVERESGKFVSREEIGDQIRESLENADAGTFYGGADGDSAYNVIDWSVEDL